MPMELSNLSVAELRKMANEINLEIEKRESKAKELVLAQIKQLVESAGMSMKEVVRLGRKGSMKNSKRPATTYVNPENPKQVWSGRGRRPAWVNAVLTSGRSLKEIQKR